MKISKYLLILLTLSMGCSKNFLDAPLQGQSTPSNDPNVATNLVTGAYSSLIYTDAGGPFGGFDTHGFAFISATNIMSDDADKGSFAGDQESTAGQFDDFSYTSGNSFINSVWSGHYAAISRVNNSLNAIAVAPIDSATARRLRGEVLFIRAYYYFNLVRFFGGVPIVTEIPDGPQAANTNPAFVTRASAQDVYNTEIIPDLQYSIANCPLRGNTPSGRITKGAAQTLLAKVNMYLKNWQATKDLTDSVMTEGYALAPDYRTLWREVGDNNVESIFEIETGSYGNTDAGIPLYSECQGPRAFSGGWNNPGFNYPTGDLGWGFGTPTQTLINSYEPNDTIRRNATIIALNPDPNAPYGAILWDGFVIPNQSKVQNSTYNYKAYHSERNDNIEPYFGNRDRKEKNVHLLRYAEVLLMNAEAANELNMTGVAQSDLNQVRNRAGLTNTVAGDQTSLRNAIWQERHVELALEHDRFFDIVRQGRAAQVMTAAGKNFTAGKNEILPIPGVQIALSGGKLTQNPGY